MIRVKSWADRMGFPTGISGETFRGIEISERNRATVFAKERDDIEQLYAYMVSNYRLKGVKAVLFGINSGDDILYAVYCRNGFIKDSRTPPGGKSARGNSSAVRHPAVSGTRTGRASSRRPNRGNKPRDRRDDRIRVVYFSADEASGGSNSNHTVGEGTESSWSGVE